MALQLTTYTEIKEHIGLAASTHDEFLVVLAAAVDEAVEDWLLRPLEDTGSDVTEFYDGTASDTLQLRRWPVQSITEINIDADRAFAATTAVAAGDFVSYDRTGLVRLLPASVGSVLVQGSQTFGSGRQSVKVVYRGGYRDTSPGTAVPKSLKAAATMWATAIFNMRRDQGLLTRSNSEVSDTYLLAFMPNTVRLMLSRYRPGYLENAGSSA